jgi:hypothetical protein
LATSANGIAAADDLVGPHLRWRSTHHFGALAGFAVNSIAAWHRPDASGGDQPSYRIIHPRPAASLSASHFEGRAGWNTRAPIAGAPVIPELLLLGSMTLGEA